MTPEKQRIAIAKLCGWTFVMYKCHPNVKCYPPKRHWTPPKNFEKEVYKVGYNIGYGSIYRTKNVYEDDEIPDYLNDLNAIYEAESLLTHSQRSFYGDEIENILKRDTPESQRGTKEFLLVHTTAAQRAEALLRTLNLWEEN